MARKITIKATRGASRVLKAKIREQLVAADIGEVLVSLAKWRIANGGDSEHKYPELWATATGLGYRSGGQPLRDTGILMSSITQKTQMKGGSSVVMTLIDGTPDGYGVKHQKGFTNRGPQAIPLTRAAARVLGEPPHKRREVRNLGLVEDEDYIWVKGNTEVPQRKIFNMPPEDVRDIRDAVEDVVKGVRFGS